MELPVLNPATEQKQEDPLFLRWMQGNIPVVYEAMGVDLSVNDRFPSYLCCKPNMGDIIESLSGRRLSVKGVIHTVEVNRAVLRIILGRDTGGQHAESGGSQDGDW